MSTRGSPTASILWNTMDLGYLAVVAVHGGHGNGTLKPGDRRSRPAGSGRSRSKGTTSCSASRSSSPRRISISLISDERPVGRPPAHLLRSGTREDGLRPVPGSETAQEQPRLLRSGTHEDGVRCYRWLVHQCFPRLRRNRLDSGLWSVDSFVRCSARRKIQEHANLPSCQDDRFRSMLKKRIRRPSLSKLACRVLKAGRRHDLPRCSANLGMVRTLSPARALRRAALEKKRA